MYPALKKALWDEIDAALAATWRAKPSGKATRSRAYALAKAPVTPYLVVEYGDFAGGRFSLLLALGNGAAPGTDTNYSGVLACPAPGAVCLVDAALLEPGCGPVSIPLEWHVPPRERVLEALAIDDARPVLESLGVTADERHHMLSLEILQAFGVAIRPDDYRLPAATRGRPAGPLGARDGEDHRPGRRMRCLTPVSLPHPATKDHR